MEPSKEWELTSPSFRCTVNLRNGSLTNWNRDCWSTYCWFRGGKWRLELRKEDGFNLYIQMTDGCLNRAFPAYAHLEGAEDATGRTTNVDGTRTAFQLLHLSFDELHLLLPGNPMFYMVSVRVFLGEKKDCTRTESKFNRAPSHMTSSPCQDNLLDDIAKLLQEDNPDTDVFLLCGDLEFKAHKNILSARSPVFSKMLHSDMEEGRTGKVTVHDMTPDVFRPFLRYLYSGKLTDLTVDSARNLLEAGDRFEVPALVKRCEEYLVDNLTEENVCEMLVLSDVHRALTMKEATVDYIIRKKIPLKGEWPSFCRDHPVLTNEVLNHYFKLQNQL